MFIFFVKETNVESKFGEKSSSSLFAIKQGNKLCLTALIVLSESISLRLKKKVRQEQTLEEEKIFTASLKPYFTENLI